MASHGSTDDQDLSAGVDITLSSPPPGSSDHQFSEFLPDAYLTVADDSHRDVRPPFSDHEITLESEPDRALANVKDRKGGSTLEASTFQRMMTGGKRTLDPDPNDDDDEYSRSMARRRTSTQPGDVVHNCKDCGKGFKRPCDLTKHEKTHSRPWKCPEQNCKYHEYGWPTEKERDRHVNDKHSSAPQQYKCSFKLCTYASKRESNLKQHMEKAHGWTYVRSRSNGSKSREETEGSVSSACLTNRVLPDVSSYSESTVSRHPDSGSLSWQESILSPLSIDFISLEKFYPQFDDVPMQCDLGHTVPTAPQADSVPALSSNGRSARKRQHSPCKDHTVQSAPPPKKAKKVATPREKRRLMSCIYRKHAPETYNFSDAKYKTCHTTPHEYISTLIRHLERYHAAHLCHTCLGRFASPDDRAQHRSESSCKPIGGSQEGKWQKLYKALCADGVLHCPDFDDAASPSKSSPKDEVKLQQHTNNLADEDHMQANTSSQGEDAPTPSHDSPKAYLLSPPSTPQASECKLREEVHLLREENGRLLRENNALLRRVLQWESVYPVPDLGGCSGLGAMKPVMSSAENAVPSPAVSDLQLGSWDPHDDSGVGSQENARVAAEGGPASADRVLFGD